MKPRIEAATIDEYLAALPAEQRAVLTKLRKTIRAVAPKAEECISYQLPAFRLAGKVLVGFGATGKHCAFYPMSGTTVEAHKNELADHDTSKGTIRFPADRPLPAALVRKLVNARIAENAGGSGATKKPVSGASSHVVKEAVDSLKRLASKKYRDGLARYGIPADNALGVPVGKVQALGKRLGRNHELAGALWGTGIYEARMLTAFMGDPAQVGPKEMDRWCRDFDSWAICDTMCFHLFDRTPHAWKKISQWSDRREEFVKRAAFALLASVALHDKKADDEPFFESLPLIERASDDSRNFVKKGVSWALRGIGRRNAALHAAAMALAKRLSTSPDAAARWIGKDAIKDLTGKSATKRLARQQER